MPNGGASAIDLVPCLESGYLTELSTFQTRYGTLAPPFSPAKENEAEALRRLAAKGAVALGDGQHEDIAPYPMVRGKKVASRMIIDDRR